MTDADEPSQAEVRAFLAGVTGMPPHCTPISTVFIGEDTVYKLKRAVRLSFLDFTRLADRRRFLLRELELNAAAAPGLYRDVVPISRDGGELTLGGPGEAVEWVLRMARIPDGAFPLVGAAGALDPALLDALGDMVAADHARRSPVRDVDTRFPERNAAGNARAARIAGLPKAEIDTWLEQVTAALRAAAVTLVRRAGAGFVRRCHGDLHGGNICFWQGKPAPFDALEFDEDMATIDTAYDLAFLVMDLDHRFGRLAANRVMNRYVARTGDAELATLLPPFMSRRAMIRAHVTRDHAYLDRALAYLAPQPARVIAIGGLPGTGKSTLARALAPALGAAPGALVLRSDEIRKRLWGLAPEERAPPDAYSRAANARVDAALLEGVRAAAPHGVIADATFLSPDLRRAVAGCGAPFTGIWLEAPRDELARRVAGRRGDASDATEAVLEKLAARDPGPIGWHRIRADGGALDRCRELLA